MESLAREEIQLCCVTGPGKGDATERAFTSKNGAPVACRLMPFCDRMGELLSAADLAVSRAGAGTIAELIRCRLPALLVPYPHAADNHQMANGDYFERQGGGLMVGEPYLEQLQKEVREVMFNDWLLQKFRDNLTRMDRGNAAEQVAVDLEMIIRGVSSRNRDRTASAEVKAL